MDSKQVGDGDGATDDLNESWVELYVQQGGMATDSISTQSTHSGNIEKLLMEAQRESRSSSQPNSAVSSTRNSPKSPNSPNSEWANTEVTDKESPSTDWIWDWSSRPELLPSGDWSSNFKHPKRHRLSVRNSRVLRNGIFCLENLPTLLLTHACSFFLGAAVMFLYLKKYCNWAAVAAHSTLD